MTGTDNESETEVQYAPMADASVKGWVETTLPECGGRRLTIIAKAYGLSGFAKLNKEPLYHLIYDTCSRWRTASNVRETAIQPSTSFLPSK